MAPLNSGEFYNNRLKKIECKIKKFNIKNSIKKKFFQINKIILKLKF
jgi:hypothetical protein